MKFTATIRFENPDSREKKINDFMDMLLTGSDVAEEDMRSVLSASEWKEYKSYIRSPVPQKIGSTPAALKAYAQLLQAAGKLSARNTRPTLNLRNPRVFFSWHWRVTRERAYERALEYLAEVLHDYPDYALWLDRPVCFDQNSDYCPTACPEGVPRLKTSRSIYSHTSESAPSRKRRIKQATLQRAIENLNRDAGYVTAAEAPVNIPISPQIEQYFDDPFAESDADGDSRWLC